MQSESCNRGGVPDTLQGAESPEAGGVQDYRTEIVSDLAEIDADTWDALVASDPDATPFLRHAFLHALHASGSACADTGWSARYLTLWAPAANGQRERLAGAMPLYAKSHSYGEYVFDWAWADAYARNGLEYYPKWLSAIPFTPVRGARLLAENTDARRLLLQLALALAAESGLSSLHILFPNDAEADLMDEAGMMMRHGVQFHWTNAGYGSFDDFLATLSQKKRKNIRAERRHVAEAGITFRHLQGAQIDDEAWHFFNRCYRQTYREHHSTPYLNLDFFQRIGASMPQHLLLVIAERAGQPIASSLVVYDDTPGVSTLYGRYWGALEYHPCLHFETAYYQPLEFCIRHGIGTFEGGAQGEHKMARGFLPVPTRSAHWLAHPAFADAVERFLVREREGIDAYLDELNERSPFAQRD
ncbi:MULTISPECIES: GNAT family N-acetyltransferase [Cupriavidus]|uniref:N-acetyltransferase n=1 Tax=Cupriavidus pinatubonensis (strain JMP 134 / LMG 1197) TaxID=264198 RepID=Q46Y11_CUPPJ|nr:MULTISPECIES: GNAT family N-acetyltransferase [Cupriavidus]QYY30821.1 GNAT family N-acetyltransferase [Cupriavidus pinatubonensis]TPQ37644.1 N-acetyltransferase [Cupriavidus pinatubonensis]